MSSFGVHRTIGDILAFAVVVSVSPINIVAAILLLFSERPIAAASAYLAGFVAGVAGMLVVLEVVASHIDLSSGSDPSRAAAVLRILLGVGLLVAAVGEVRRRQVADGDHELPGWMDGISEFAPAKAAAAGLGIGAFNPKNLVMAVAASLVIGAAELPAGQAVVVTLVYVVLASVGVATPLIVALVLGERSTDVLTGWRAWLGRNNDAVMAVLYLVFGVVLIGNGISYL
jgi:hypothetical protein